MEFKVDLFGTESNKNKDWAMKKPLESATIAELNSLVLALYTRPNKWLNIFSKDPRVAAIDAVDLQIHPNFLKHIYPLMFDKNLEIAKKSATKIGDFIATLSPDKISDQEFSFRRLEYYEHMPHGNGVYFYDIKADDLEKLKAFSNWPFLVGVASMSPNGFVRQRAVEMLLKSNSGEEIPFLLIRLNDWVLQVREMANSTILQKLKIEFIDALLGNIQILSRVQNSSRVDKMKITEAIESFLYTHAKIDSIMNYLSKPDYIQRRMVAKIAGLSQLPILPLFDKIRKDLDSRVRLTFWLTAKSRATDQEILAMLPILHDDSDSLLRLEVLRYSVEKNLQVANQFVEDGLDDRSAGIREVARFFLTKKGKSKEDFRNHYITNLRSKVPSVAALGGLGEVGNKDDANLILPFLIHERTSIRRYAFRAISKLDPELLKGLVVEIITDGSPGMIREAREFISKHMTDFSFESLSKIYFHSPRVQTRNAVLAISEHTGKWEKLIFWLNVLDGTETIRADINERIRRWLFLFNRSYSNPTSEQINKIKELWAQKSSFIERSSAVDAIEFYLK